MAVSYPFHLGFAEPLGFFLSKSNTMPTAVLIDGAYFIKRFRAFDPENAYDAEKAADLIIRCAMNHLSAKKNQTKRELYRIFFYDCPPLEKNYTYLQFLENIKTMEKFI